MGWLEQGRLTVYQPGKPGNSGKTGLNPLQNKVVSSMLRQCLAVMRREVYYLWRDKGYGNIAGRFPPGAACFYATYSAQVLKVFQRPLWTWIVPGKAGNWLNISNTENLKVVANPGSFAEVEELIQRGEVVVGSLFRKTTPKVSP